MTENEIEMAMEGLFQGAEKVRAYKHSARKLSRNVHRQFASRIAAQMWQKEKNHFKAA
tara:strand:- start:27 stop:200 length:174 start_codon:yes stop_codon:yes gene_type:complete